MLIEGIEHVILFWLVDKDSSDLGPIVAEDEFKNFDELNAWIEEVKLDERLRGCKGFWDFAEMSEGVASGVAFSRGRYPLEPLTLEEQQEEIADYVEWSNLSEGECLERLLGVPRPRKRKDPHDAPLEDIEYLCPLCGYEYSFCRCYPRSMEVIRYDVDIYDALDALEARGFRILDHCGGHAKKRHPDGYAPKGDMFIEVDRPFDARVAVPEGFEVDEDGMCIWYHLDPNETTEQREAYLPQVQKRLADWAKSLPMPPKE